MVQVKDIVAAIEAKAPLGLQESYDNSGLLTGRMDQEVSGILVCVDMIPATVEEACRMGCNMIVSHHPPFFKGINRFTGRSLPERVLIGSIRNDLILYACHTNLDSVADGVSGALANRLGLVHQEILVPRTDDLIKVVCFIPSAYVEKVSQAMFVAGAGKVGHYDSCSFQTAGMGTFKAGDDTHPFVGKVGAHHEEPETRMETIVPRHKLKPVVQAMLESHPYEEVAYDLYPLINKNPIEGLGIIGDLDPELSELAFLERVKLLLGIPVIRHSVLRNKPIRKVAICGGSGVEFIPNAGSSGADIYLTSDIKYHTWFDVPDTMILADIGHFESEQFAINILADSLIEKFPKFAVYLTEVNTNPINYLL